MITLNLDWREVLWWMQGGEYGDTQKIQVHSLWLTAAAKDLLDEEHAVSVADKIKELLK